MDFILDRLDGPFNWAFLHNFMIIYRGMLGLRLLLWLFLLLRLNQGLHWLSNKIRFLSLLWSSIQELFIRGWGLFYCMNRQWWRIGLELRLFDFFIISIFIMFLGTGSSLNSWRYLRLNSWCTLVMHLGDLGLLLLFDWLFDLLLDMSYGLLVLSWFDWFLISNLLFWGFLVAIWWVDFGLRFFQIWLRLLNGFLNGFFSFISILWILNLHLWFIKCF